jgi:hypothetical protein
MKNIREAKEGISYERSEMANHTSNSKDDKTITGAAQPVKDIAGECVSFPIEQYHLQSMQGDQSQLYHVSGVRMYCRATNVGVSIMWQGLDYSTPGVYSRGKGLDYETSKQQAIGVMKVIVASLTRGR